MSKKQINVQDIFLNNLRTDKRKANVFLSSGIKLQGIVRGFDDFTICLENNQVQTLVYKSSVMSISPHGSFNPIKHDK